MNVLYSEPQSPVETRESRRTRRCRAQCERAFPELALALSETAHVDYVVDGPGDVPLRIELDERE